MDEADRTIRRTIALNDEYTEGNEVKSLVLIAVNAKTEAKQDLFESADAAIDFLCECYKKGHFETEEKKKRLGHILSNRRACSILANNPEKIDEMMNLSDDYQTNSATGETCICHNESVARSVNADSTNGGRP